METTLKTNQTITLSKKHARSIPQKIESKFWENAESNRFGIIPMQLFIMGCISGIAAAFGAEADTIKLALVAFPTVIALALTLSVSPMKVIIYATSIAIICDLLVFVI